MLLINKFLFYFQIVLSKRLFMAILVILTLCKPSEQRSINYQDSFNSLKQWINIKSLKIQHNVYEKTESNPHGSNSANFTSGLNPFILNKRSG